MNKKTEPEQFEAQGWVVVPKGQLITLLPSKKEVYDPWMRQDDPCTITYAIRCSYESQA